MKGSDSGADHKNALSKEILAALPLRSRTQRDLAIDYMNPREQLASYTQSEDQILPFDYSTLTFIAPFDGVAKQQIEMVKRGIRSWAAEDSKYQPDSVAEDEALNSGDPAFEKEMTWQAMYRKNLDWMHQVALDQTSSL
jgi:hypothetical protein